MLQCFLGGGWRSAAPAIFACGHIEVWPLYNVPGGCVGIHIPQLTPDSDTHILISRSRCHDCRRVQVYASCCYARGYPVHYKFRWKVES